MEQQLYEMLRQCTLRVSVLGKTGHGTGFFVAPGLILTCAHVLKAAQPDTTSVEVSWNSQLHPAQITRFLPDPDLALLQVNMTDHPCVYLQEEAIPFDALYSYGYPDDHPDGDPITFTLEGKAGKQGEQLKFKSGQVRPGMSGAPLLNVRTGHVCGVVQLTRDRNNDLGGRAIPTTTVFRVFSEIVTLQQQFHQQDKHWAQYLTPQQRQVQGLMIPLDTVDAIEVFYSYVEEDEKLVKELQKHLVLLKRLKIITDWYPGKVTLEGGEPDEQIIKHLNSARIILLLISPDFIFSEEHGNVEVELALERYNTKEAVIIPINLRNIDNWREMPFGKLQAIPRNNKPVIEWSNRDAAFAEIAREIREVVERLKAKP